MKEHHISEPRINERIRVPEVRLVGPNGEQVGIVRVEDALRLAAEADLDLVEVAPMARPPVAKLMDFGKYKYEAALKAREARKNQVNTVIKEIKLRPKIDPHDYGTKKGHVERFLKGGDKVKVTIMFRGREQSRPELGFRLLQKLAEDISELGFVESAPKQDGRNMIMVIGPTKKKAEAKAEARRARETHAPAAAASSRPGTSPTPAEATSAGVVEPSEAPGIQTLAVEAPVVETPAAEAPVLTAPAAHAPAAEAPVQAPAETVTPDVAPAPGGGTCSGQTRATHDGHGCPHGSCDACVRDTKARRSTTECATPSGPEAGRCEGGSDQGNGSKGERAPADSDATTRAAPIVEPTVELTPSPTPDHLTPVDNVARDLTRRRSAAMPKMKTHSGAKKRFRVTGTGKIMREQAGGRHRLEVKSSKEMRSLAGDLQLSAPDSKKAKRLLGR